MKELLNEFVEYLRECGEDAYYVFENTEKAIDKFLAQRNPTLDDLVNNKVTATVSVELPSGTKEITARMKAPEDIENCKKGNILVILLTNGEQYSGYFEGYDDDELHLKSFSNNNLCGLKIEWIRYFFEEITDDDVDEEE